MITNQSTQKRWTLHIPVKIHSLSVKQNGRLAASQYPMMRTWRMSDFTGCNDKGVYSFKKRCYTTHPNQYMSLCICPLSLSLSLLSLTLSRILDVPFNMYIYKHSIYTCLVSVLHKRSVLCVSALLMYMYLLCVYICFVYIYVLCE